MKVDGSLKSLLQGVSQQPPRDRLPGQCTAQVNMSADPVTGLTRRPPTDLVGELVTTANVNSWFDFETKNGNKYVAAFYNNTLGIWNINAQAQALTINADAAAYLTGSTSKFVCTGQENLVYVANTSRTVAMDTALSAYSNMGAGSDPQGIIQVLGGAYGRKYSITINGTVVASMKPPDGGAPIHSKYITTTYIAEVLVWLMQNAYPATPLPAHFYAVDNAEFAGTGTIIAPDWSVVRKDDIIHITKNTAGTFTLTVTDDNGNLNMKGMTDSVPDVSDLPRYGVQGYVARVATETDPEEDLWVQFIVEAGAAMGAGFGLPGYWQETVAPSIKYSLNDATMPHIIEYDPVADDFTFRRGTWKDRLVGTEVSNPEPSFVGNRVQDISTMQNRLVMLAGKNAIMSRTNKPDDFWMGSASAIVDSDPIDISSNAVQTSNMIYAVPHNRDLVIFAERGQFIIFGRTALTPANAAMVLTTAFEASLNARPAGAGRNVFFPITYGRFSGMREFYTEGGTDINDTRPITQHVKKYIEGTVTQMATASNYDLLFVTTTAANTDMYVYQFIWSDTEKVQSAWSTWRFAHKILYTFFDRDVYYVIVQDGSEIVLLRMPIDVEDSIGMEFPAYLDYRFDVFNCNLQFLLPASWIGDEDLAIVQGPNCPNPGMSVQIDTIIGDTVTLKEDMQGGDIIVGIRYRSSYMPTMPLVKDADGVVVGTGILRAKSLMVQMENTGDLNGRTFSKWVQNETVKFQGRIIGDIGNVVGVPALYTGKFVLPVRSKTDLIEAEFFTESFYPMTMLDIEWDGQYSKRGRRLRTGGE